MKKYICKTFALITRDMVILLLIIGEEMLSI